MVFCRVVYRCAVSQFDDAGRSIPPGPSCCPVVFAILSGPRAVHHAGLYPSALFDTPLIAPALSTIIINFTHLINRLHGFLTYIQIHFPLLGHNRRKFRSQTSDNMDR